MAQSNLSSGNFTNFSVNPGLNMFQTQQQQQQQQQQPSQQQQNVPLTSLFMPKIFNDDRDNIIGLFNQIQAFWGAGKAYYSAFNPPYELNKTDSFNRFKTISYSEEKNLEEKLFFLIRYVDEQQLRTNLVQYEQNFKQFIGQNHTVKLELKTILPDSKALIAIMVTENATSKIIPDAQLRTNFNQPQWKQQLNQIFINNFVEIIFTSLSKQEIEAYLSSPPKGIDERIWEQAKLENPDPQRFIPVPLIGFKALNDRFKLQEKEIHQQQLRLKQMIDNVSTLESNISQFKAKFEECRRKHDNLSYRVLRKMIVQEVQRKRTMPIQAEEDKLRADLEAIQAELNVPTKFQGCLNELMSQLRQMQCQNPLIGKISFDKSSMNEYLQFLNEENRGIMSLVEILKKDIQDIRLSLNDGKKSTI
ncbi:nuclear pore complex protein Nup54 [Dermatophagoides farinae]|uniref:Nuclear pore complex protein Nup54 n=1 Tax=Dermatophagoides farinae TaxID=6954 RepID=A0A922HWP0_DERFA|nr:nuclear pore complex protein Nup54-like [Dermatophagoides farinae]KAH7645742.1 nuclear pore complex protein nup54-like protein [Dermatophagoides farinae]KAH9515931.1 Nuclear pore complex protein Nup54 [Dermatophagoides farinae]